MLPSAPTEVNVDCDCEGVRVGIEAGVVVEVEEGVEVEVGVVLEEVDEGDCDVGVDDGGDVELGVVREGVDDGVALGVDTGVELPKYQQG